MPLANPDGKPVLQYFLRALPWCVAALAMCAYALSFYPGHMSFDAAYIYWQARGGETSDIFSPTLVRVWRVLNPLIEGPGGIFLLHLGAFWFGLTVLAKQLSDRLWRQLGFMFAAACAPVIFVMYTHVWTDVGMMSALTCASACGARYRSNTRIVWLIAAMAALTYALAMRHNALPAVMPFVYYISFFYWRQRLQKTPSIAQAGALGSAFLLGSLLIVALINRQVDRRVDLWPALQLWDLAALSIASDEQLLPSYAVGSNMDVQDLRQAFRSWSNTPLFAQTHAGVRDPFSPLWTLSEQRQLSRAWLAAIAHHPLAYITHRARVVVALAGMHALDRPRELIYFDGQLKFRDNPAVEPNLSRPHAFWMWAFDFLRVGIGLAAWPYLALLLGAMWLARRWRFLRDTSLAQIVLLSGLLYALPLLIVAPSAELRYLAWSCLSAVLGTGLALNAKPLLKDQGMAKIVKLT